MKRKDHGRIVKKHFFGHNRRESTLELSSTMATIFRREAAIILITAPRTIVTLLACIYGFTLMCMPPTARASTSESGLANWFDSVYLQAGYGIHWTDSDDRAGLPLLGGFEASHDNRHHVGIILFNNSFGQFSQYYYYGYKWRLPFISESAHVKLTGGLIYGYVDEFEDKLAFISDGWAPVIIPSIGWKHGRFGVDVGILGDAGLMVVIGYDVWQR